MSVNGDTHVLRWPGQVLCAEDLRRGLNGHRELIVSPNAVITPLALEHLRSNGVQMSRHADERQNGKASWGYAQQRPHPFVDSAVQALGREGIALRSLQVEKREPAAFSKAIAECVAKGECHGGVVFSDDPAIICCVANKFPGLRAAAIMCVAQAARAVLTLGANLLVVEMPGRTYFEIRQILRNVAAKQSACPDGVACTLQELDGHAHR